MHVHGNCNPCSGAVTKQLAKARQLVRGRTSVEHLAIASSAESVRGVLMSGQGPPLRAILSAGLQLAIVDPGTVAPDPAKPVRYEIQRAPYES